MDFEGVKQDDPAEGAVENVNLSPDGAHVSRDWLRSSLVALTPHALGVFRLVVAFLFMAHGTQKLFGYPPAEGMPTFPVDSLMGTAGLIESVGGALILLGLFTRPVAFLLTAEMATAYVSQHLPQGVWPVLNGGELAGLYCVSFLFIAVAGPGRWSVDALLEAARLRRQSAGRRHHGKWAHQH
jgi:putative oxidoreductase